MSMYREDPTIESLKKLEALKVKQENTKIDLLTEEQREKIIKRNLLNKDMLVFHEKHGDRYFDASTPELIFKACLKILTERNKDNWYRISEVSDSFTGLRTEDIEALPDTDKFKEMKKDAIKKYYNYLNSYICNLTDVHFQREVDYAIKNKDGLFAYELCEQRGAGEYEGMEFETFEKVD